MTEELMMKLGIEGRMIERMLEEMIELNLAFCLSFCLGKTSEY